MITDEFCDVGRQLLAKINGRMHEGRCAQSGCIGECAAIDEDSNGLWWAALYIWDHEFNDPARVAKWFHDAGAIEVLITHVLHDEGNGDRDGRTFDGARAWHVQFSMPQSAVSTAQGLSGTNIYTHAASTVAQGHVRKPTI